MDRLALALATPTDADALIALWFEAFPLKFGHLMGDALLPLLQNWFKHVPRVFAHTYLARMDGACVGYIQFGTKGSTRMTEGLWGLWSAAWHHLGGSRAAICMLRLALGEFFERTRSGELFIKMLGVHSNNRGQGVGASLLEFAEAHARSLGLRRLRLNVVGENTGAIRLYERFGFVRGVQHRFLVRWVLGSSGYYSMTKDL